MRFDLQKLDERIKKLQELRRLATDPETVAMLVDFISSSDDRSKPVSSVGSAPNYSPDTRELAKEVAAAKDGGGLWTKVKG